MLGTSRPTEQITAAHDQIYRSLRGQIMHGELAPGMALTLRGLAETYGMSMTPVREATRRLVAEGALTLSKSGRLTTPALSSERLEELASIRALIEPELAIRALPRAHSALIDRLVRINGEIAESIVKKDAVGYIRGNLEFHRTLYLRAQSPSMLAMVETIWLQLGPTMRELYGRLLSTELPRHHRLIISSLQAGDEPGLKLAVRGDVTQGLRLLAG